MQDAAAAVAPPVAPVIPTASTLELLVGLVLILASLAVAPLAIELARRIFPGRNIFFARWGFSHVLILVLVFFAASIAVGGAIAATGGERDIAGLPVIAYGAVVFGCMAAAVVRIAVLRDPESWRSLGLRAGGNLRAMAVAAVAYVAALPGILGVISAWPWLLQKLGYEAHEQDVTEIARNLHGVQLVAGGLLIVVAMPLLEEILFRSFLQPLLVQNLGDRGGIVVTSAVFAALHGVSAFLPVFVLALVLGGVMLRTQRLSAVWLMHALHNGLTLVYMISNHGSDSAVH